MGFTDARERTGDVPSLFAMMKIGRGSVRPLANLS